MSEIFFLILSECTLFSIHCTGFHNLDDGRYKILSEHILQDYLMVLNNFPVPSFDEHTEQIDDLTET